MQKKLFFIFFFISDIVSAYKLLERFPSFMSRVFGFSACLFFINVLLILWVRYLVRQPEEVQKEIILPVGEDKGVANYSLYEILNNSWSKLRRVQFLYGEAVVSFFVMFYIIFLIGMSFASGKVNVFLELKNAFSLNLLPYYIGFCLSSMTIIIVAFVQNKKNNALGPLRREFIIKLIQAIFITAFYEAGPAFVLIAFTSFMRLGSRYMP
jgi:hypothetical protein